MSNKPATVNGHEGRPDKRASQIARDLEAEIIRRGWPIGESMGSEHDLQQRYRVSRSVLREAVRLVEHHQVARMRRGPNGGLLITEPDAVPATRAVVIYLEHRGTTITDLFHARLLLEPLAASLAAERIDEDGIDRLRAVVDGMPSEDFHAELAQHAKNPVLQLFIDVLVRMTQLYCPGSGSRAKSDGADMRAMNEMRGEHSDIVAAVTAGDSARAKTLSERRVESVTTWLQPGPRTRRRRRSMSPKASHGKLAEVLAATIRDDIVATGWPVGSVVGSEVQLLERYRVSRSVLREAVRLLEYHAVAQMRRGPGGGLVVSKPQAQASIDTVALYLQYRKPGREDLRVVREAIEIDNVAKIIRRRTESGVQTFLDSYRLAHDEIAGDLRKAAAAESSFHTGLAELAGNAVLELFLRILIELLRRDSASAAQPIPSSADVTEIERAHERIVEAIIDGDDSLARYRTRRHLDAVASWWL